MRTGFLAFTLLIWSSSSVFSAPLDINTHTAAVPEQSYQLAATWFLPDWQAGMTNRTQDGSGSSEVSYSCSDYGYATSVPANAICRAVNPIPGKSLTCYTACVCKSGYIQAGSSVSAGCMADCSGYTLGSPNCSNGQNTEYCSGDSRYYRCTGTACPTTITCLAGGHCVQTAEDIQPGCGSGCVSCEPCPTSLSCANGAKCASYGTKPEGCPDVCSQCCPESLACENGCKTYSRETGCSDVCIECKAKTCDKPDGSCWVLKSSTPSTTPTTTAPTTTTATTTAPTTTIACTTPLKVYMESKTDTYTNACDATYTRPCITVKPGYGWQQVTIDQTIFKDSLTVTPSSPTGMSSQTDTEGAWPATYDQMFEEFTSCEKYYHRECRLYSSFEGFYAQGTVWNDYSSSSGSSSTPSTGTPSSTPTTSCPTTTNSYGYPNPYTAVSDQRDSGCGWTYSRCCYAPADGAGWTEIADTGSTVLPSAIPDSPTSSCSSVISGEYMSWEGNQPINCSGTVKFDIACDGTVYFKCVYDGSATTSIDISTMPTVISGRTLKPIKTVGERGMTTTTQTLSSCGKSYQRTCRVPTDEGVWYVLNAGETSASMVTSCGINYSRYPSTTCTVPSFPNCSGGSWFKLQANNGCLTYDACTTETPTTSTGNDQICLLSSEVRMKEYAGYIEGWFAPYDKPSCYYYGTGKFKQLVSGKDCDGNTYYACLVSGTTGYDSFSCSGAQNHGLQLTSIETSSCNIPCDVQFYASTVNPDGTTGGGAVPTAYICDGAYLINPSAAREMPISVVPWSPSGNTSTSSSEPTTSTTTTTPSEPTTSTTTTTPSEPTTSTTTTTPSEPTTSTTTTTPSEPTTSTTTTTPSEPTTSTTTTTPSEPTTSTTTTTPSEPTTSTTTTTPSEPTTSTTTTSQPTTATPSTSTASPSISVPSATATASPA